ncbi:uncharacterized protein tp53i13 [Pristis pectinata]|uniref:uncharacterized protein tp53i13 n=1 Tax=Pristis pectinata TaxID=685728 RepID=UPI00223D3BBF|nr:uncharacterized protein tp53i13 [Pristis pectinata]
MARDPCRGYMEADPGVGLLLLLWALLAEARARWAPCDTGKFKLQVDLPPVEELTCPGPTWALPELVIPSLAKIYPEQKATHVCMDKQIVYNMRIPNSGMHRPNWAVYGEYLFVPAQRWVHNLQCGGIAFLYHPCTHPSLKEELSLLARACVYKHIITPHLNLTQERPLALVAWGKSLEMSEVNLAEAVSWLRKSVNRACDSQLKDDGLYKFLLIQKAKLVSDNNDGIICPADQVQKLQHYFKKRDLQSTATKWNKVGDRTMRYLPNRHVILRRRRNVNPHEPTPISKQVAVLSKALEQKNKKDEDSATNFVANLQVTTLPTGHAVVTREWLQQTVVTLTGKSENGLVRRTIASQEVKGSYGIGGRQNRMGNESKFAISVLKDSSKTHPHTFQSNRTSDLLKTDNQAANEPDSEHFQMHNLSHSSLNVQVKTHWASDQQGEIEKGGRITDKANQLVGTSAFKEQGTVKIIAETLSVTDSKGLNGDRGQVNNTLVSGKNIELYKNDGMKQNGNSNKSYTEEADSDRLIPKGEMGINVTLTIHARGNHNATATVESGSIRCKCDGALQNVQVDSKGADSTDLKAAIVKATAEDRMIYVPTPRTEEAAWAAAALTFLFVFLTLAVLYTRLYKKFVKSDSLYWAPVLAVDGKENVADIIKRRIIRLGKKRKKRPLYKKKSISPYAVLPSDNSD